MGIGGSSQRHQQPRSGKSFGALDHHFGISGLGGKHVANEGGAFPVERLLPTLY